MIDLTLVSDVLSRTIAGVIAPLILSSLTALALYFRKWVSENLRPLLVGVLTGSVLAVSIAFIFFPKPSPSQTPSIVQEPQQPSVSSAPEPECPPQPIADSPQQIFKWYQQFPNRVHADEIAGKAYYGYCVEWELLIHKYYPDKAYPKYPDASTVESIIDPTLKIFCTFREKKPEAFRLEHGKKVLFKGMVKRIDEDHILLDKCEILKFL